MANNNSHAGTPSPRWAFWKWYLIYSAYEPTTVYLKRLRIVQTPWFGVLLHWIYLPDRDRDAHDHPWPFASFIVRGGYKEEVSAAVTDQYGRWLGGEPYMRKHRRFSWHRTGLNMVHQITALKDRTVTLLLVGPRVREWGFYTNAGWVQWDVYDRTGREGPDPFDS
jgi:hypothetical protein